MQEKVHEQEGRDFTGADLSEPRTANREPRTVAAAIVHAIDLPADPTLTDLTLRATQT